MAYRIWGSENSPYSVKVRSYFRYKAIPHEWILRTPETAAEVKKFAKLPIVPVVATPDGRGMQDSTPILEAMEKVVEKPSIQPDDAAARFLSQLLEEFGDEWLNKSMFHLRWTREIDQQRCSRRLVEEMFGPGAPEDALERAAKGLRERMTNRIGFAVGSNPRTAAFIESNFREILVVLEAHLSKRAYLFGGRPALADFGMAPQIYEVLVDPTGSEIMRDFPSVSAWVRRMLAPSASAGFAELDALLPTLEPILHQVGLFLRWSAANARACAAGAKEMEVDLGGVSWWQVVGSPQRYQEKTLRELRAKFQAASGDERLVAILSRTGCLEDLAASVPSKL